jgi:hypothetical protein
VKYEEMDEAGETKNTGFNFLLDLPEVDIDPDNIQCYRI